jgi:UDP-glucose 4-epimerase
VEDVAAANLLALEHAGVTGPVNVGTGIETSVNDLYRQLAGAARIQMPARHGPAKPGEQRRSCLSPALARRVLGWAPSVPLEKGLERTFEFFKTQIDTRGTTA